MPEKIVCCPDVFTFRAFPETDKPKQTCFIIMPFRKKTIDERRIQEVYNNHIVKVVEKCGLECIRADNPKYFRNGKPIMEQIWKAICSADLVLGEFTTGNPNVTYEAGIAHAIGKPLIAVAQSTDKLPFDNKHLRFTEYEPTEAGYSALECELELVIKDYLTELKRCGHYPQRFVESVQPDPKLKQELAEWRERSSKMEAELERVGTQLQSADRKCKEQENEMQKLRSEFEKKEAVYKEEYNKLLKQISGLNMVNRVALTSDSVGSVYRFGRYDGRELDWLVLDVDTRKKRALLITKDIVEKKSYDEKGGGVTWETCTLREWLNNDFLKEFTPEDMAQIPDTLLDNANNPQYKTVGGNPTRDKVFLLSIDEFNRYFKGVNDAGRATTYEGERHWWWLRSPGNSPSHAAFVYSVGDVNSYGSGTSSASGGVRPAFWLNL